MKLQGALQGALQAEGKKHMLRLGGQSIGVVEDLRVFCS